MRNEEDCKKNERFLFCDTYLSDKGIELSQKETIRRFTNRDKNELYQKYITWKKKDNEIIVFALYAYADLKLKKEFDCIFNYDNPDEFVLEKFILTQSIYEGWVPIDTVEDGHKHLLVFSFENEIPKIFFNLHKEETLRDTRPKIHTKLGLCNQKDFETISNHLKKRHLLMEKYGLEYWKYMDEEI
ncbi:hypothetical protein [Flavobacterium branchiicola]|uniref:Uncharacterized protein n=1 Tax=Flavobacterium branchiicola TaxID=1114875 RepID=A0ABV9PGC2_9FLAO|nr:hypothetical protein [Flavobacterium branchiicola]MBS7253872.1 hypothetical protein [Flavobacterium branchiicola]